MTTPAPFVQAEQAIAALEAMRAVCSAATKGPWIGDAAYQEEWTDHPQQTMNFACLFVDDQLQLPVLPLMENPFASTEEARRVDATLQFIAAARTWTPALIDVLLAILADAKGKLLSDDEHEWAVASAGNGDTKSARELGLHDTAAAQIERIWRMVMEVGNDG